MKQVFKKILRFLNLIIISPKDPEGIKKLKKTFQHNERSFVYNGIKYLVDCLYCHASPGVIETIITELTSNKTNGGKILNLGGGTGQVSSIYESIGFNVYNLDIDVTQEDNKNIKYDLNQETQIPFPDKSFDVILCQEIIEHIENPWKLLREAKRLLKDTGTIIVTTPNIASLQSKIMFLFTGYFKWFTPNCFNYHINPIPHWEVDLIAKKSGLIVRSMKGSGDYFFNRNNKTSKKILQKNESIIYFITK